MEKKEYGHSATFNVIDLSPSISSMDNPNLRINYFPEGESNVNSRKQEEQGKDTKHEETEAL
ncbi:hypothetical protein CR513_13653, partial [Mucuna pruriens]